MREPCAVHPWRQVRTTPDHRAACCDCGHIWGEPCPDHVLGEGCVRCRPVFALITSGHAVSTIDGIFVGDGVRNNRAAS